MKGILLVVKTVLLRKPCHCLPLCASRANSSVRARACWMALEFLFAGMLL